MTSFPFQIGIHGIQIEFVNHNGDTKTATYLPEVALDHGTQCGVGVWFCTRNVFCVSFQCMCCPSFSPPPSPVLSPHSFLPPLSFHPTPSSLPAHPFPSTHEGWSKVETIDSLLRKGGHKGQISESVRRTIRLMRYQSEVCTVTYNEYCKYTQNHKP